MNVSGESISTKIVIKDKEGERVGERFSLFLREFSSDGVNKDYKMQIAILSEKVVATMYVDFEQLSDWDLDLSTSVMAEYYRFEKYLVEAVESVHRSEYMQITSPVQQNQIQYSIAFYNTRTHYKLRDLKSNCIGKLTSLCATVTRTSEVRPELLFGTFVCLDCNQLVLNVEQQFKYTEPVRCTSPTCQNTSRWHLNHELSKFVDWQKVRVQENANEIPSGSMPRSLDVILRHDAVEKAKAGDKCVFTGMLIVVPDVGALRLPGAPVTAYKEPPSGGGFASQGVQGLKELGVKDLSYKLVFLAYAVQTAGSKVGAAINIRDETEQEVVSQFSEQERKEIFTMKADRDFYKNIVNSFAPALYGHEDIKRGILLMLFGGVHKVTPEGINLRGDINVCLIGDPSVAKSQFLKYVVGIVPRSVYTSGKASSAAGLTASVVRDHDTGDFNFEAGALLLADNGIACIDEFDKMEPHDQVAIHEAMEQQTISIAKAGIQATLNARTSILAAANPIGGRYDRLKDFKGNVNITPAIMSRFDLLFVLLDENDEEIDTKLAQHIVRVHQRKDKAIDPLYSTAQIQRYIRFAKSLKPELTKDAQRMLVEEYRNLRRSDVFSGRRQQAFRITVRQLESVIRLSEALARLHLDIEVRESYVVEAARLVRKSLIHIESKDVILETTSIPGRFDNIDIPNQSDKPDTQGTRSDGSNPKRSKTKNTGDKVSTVTITKQRYIQIMECLALELKRRQQHDKQFTGVPQRELINWFVENCSKVTGEEELTKEYKIVRAAIKMIINKERILCISIPAAKEDDQYLMVDAHYQFT